MRIIFLTCVCLGLMACQDSAPGSQEFTADSRSSSSDLSLNGASDMTVTETSRPQPSTDARLGGTQPDSETDGTDDPPMNGDARVDVGVNLQDMNTEPEDKLCPPVDVDCDDIEPHLADAPNRYPMVFVHGMGGFENLGPWDYFYGIPMMLRQNGYDAHITVTDPFNSSEIRTDQLTPQIDQILACTCSTKVNLIAHSQGGIDARLLISDRGYGNRIASLTTISSPHRGTAIADALLGLTNGPIDGLVDGFLDVFTGLVWGESNEDPNLRVAMMSCSRPAMDEFNEAYPNDDRVAYFSYAGFSGRFADGRPECEGSERPIPRHGDTVAPEFLAGFLFLGGILTANDGLVTVESAKWGRFMGCLPADHLDEIGQLGGIVDVFDYRSFYREHTEFLCQEGF
jgi:triacylglycerol esterase/lipase EstA (alpha/beta hydrolase family)